MSENYELLYAGFDTLYVTIMGALVQAQLEKLQATRAEAQRTQTAQPIYIGQGQYDAQVHPSGQRGGYAYRLEAGPTDIVWSIKHSTDVRQWNLFASAGSACLLTHGLDGVKARIWRDLIAMGARWADHSINRIDFAMDFKVLDFKLDPTRIVAHPHTGVRNYTGPANDNETSTAYSTRGRHVESITIGKMPGRQIIIYDKRREVIQRQKRYWFDVWGIDQNDRTFDVYRVEFRAGKKHLKDKWQMSTFKDIENSIGDVFLMAAEKIRYLDDAQHDSNVTRQAQHPFWDAVQHSLSTALDFQRCGLVPEQVKYVLRKQKIATFKNLLIANAISYGFALGLDTEEAMENLPSIAQEVLNSFIVNKPEEFEEKFAKVSQKFRFIKGVD